MEQLPKVKIMYSEFLDEVFTIFSTSDNFQESTSFKKVSFPKILTKDQLLEKQKVFKSEWLKYESKIFRVMCELTTLTFNRNVIDVYIVRATPRTFARPIIICGLISHEEFVRILTHETVHLLLESLGDSKQKLDKILTKMFPDESRVTRIHIVVYSILACIYEVIFPDIDKMVLEKKSAKNHRTKEYTRSIEIAESYGYKKIIDDLKIAML